jgi:hypothetical protein
MIANAVQMDAANRDPVSRTMKITSCQTEGWAAEKSKPGIGYSLNLNFERQAWPIPAFRKSRTVQNRKPRPPWEIQPVSKVFPAAISAKIAA